MTTHTLLDFDLSESSDDSDFRIEDHDDDSDDCSVNTNDEQSENDESDDDDDSDDGDNSEDEFAAFKSDLGRKDDDENKLTTSQLLAQSKAKEAQAKMLAKPICCACLGDRSDDTNEIVECDNCGISVHEGCYGISDSASVSSTVSSCSTEPWFCEACKANIADPVCELCPNKGGIFKETDVGKWVHLVCALYVPGVAFGEVDHLSSVTLFEMPYSKWGAKTCSLCEDARFARCGVCIGCDAGMCKTFFHVTCAQAAGLLSETHSEEADHADPFYAHCKIHSDKTLIKHRKRNYNALRMKMSYRNCNGEQKKLQTASPGQKRIERKLKKHRNKYIHNKMIKSEPWVPTQKIPRLLTTSASACRRLLMKAELMGIDIAALEFQEAQVASLNDVRKKWHIPPAFSVEFIGYYLDRISRSKDVKKNLQQQLELNKTLVSEQQNLREKYDEVLAIRSEQNSIKNALVDTVEQLHTTIRALCPNKSLPTINNISRPPVKSSTPIPVPPLPLPTLPSRPMSVPTAAALKMGVGFPLTNLPGTSDDTNRILSTQCQNKTELLRECGICKRVNDQHLLAKCDTCHLHYHLGCLTPPLTRHPKKSKIYGWQCSECDEDNPDGVVQLTTGPRKSRTKYSKDGTIVPVDSSRDVSLDESAEDEKSIVLLPKSPLQSKSPPPTVIKKADNKCDKVEKLENQHLIEESTIAITSSNSPKPLASSDASSTPTKRTTKKKSNLDKVIEAVSRGFIGKEANSHNKTNEKKRIKSPAGEPKPSETIEKSNEKNKIKSPVRNLKSIKTIEKPIEEDKIKSPARDAKASETNLKSNEKDKIRSPARDAKLSETKEKLIEKNRFKSPVTDPKPNEANEKINEKNKVRSLAKQPMLSKTIDIVELISDSKRACEPENGSPRPKIKSSKKWKNEHATPSDATENLKNEYQSSEEMQAIPSNNSINKAEIASANLTNGTTPGTQAENMKLESIHKQSRKRRKEKHRNKHGLDGDRSSSREHKKKRKRRNYDIENPGTLSDGVPKIKIKFKALPLPGETATESHYFYVPANMVRPSEFRRTRPASANSLVDEVTSTPFEPKSPTPTSPPPPPPPRVKPAQFKPVLSKILPPIRTRRLSVLLSPPKATMMRRQSTPVTAVSSNSNDTNEIHVCDVCQVSGTVVDLVKCDECKKSYHFRCLDPPLKKTPKRRGYSWHCADCDPTDKEDN